MSFIVFIRKRKYEKYFERRIGGSVWFDLMVNKNDFYGQNQVYPGVKFKL